MTADASQANTNKSAHVLVTRPRAQAQGLAAALRECGVTVTVFPVIDIQTFSVDDDLAKSSSSLAVSASNNTIQDDAILVFLSRNAVVGGLRVLEAAGQPINGSYNLVAVGPATADEIRGHTTGLDVQLPTHEYSSEGLLAMPVFSEPSGLQVIVFCGENPRPLLAQTLTSRGARVRQIPVYRRIRPPVDEIYQIERWGEKGYENAPTIIMLTSVEAASNLKQMMGTDFVAAVSALSIIVAGRRIESACRRMGYTGRCEIAASAQDADMIAALMRLG